MAKGGGDKQTTTTAVPKEFRPYYTEAFGIARNASGQISGKPYPGPFVAPTNPAQTGGANARLSALTSIDPSTGRSTIDLGEAMARGDFLRPETNPYLAANVDTALGQATRSFNRDLLPRLRAQATTSGAYGGNRSEIAQSLLAAEVDRQMKEAAMAAYLQNYGTERQLQLQAPTLIQRGIGLTQLPGALQSEIGDYLQQLEQQQIQGRLAAFEERNTAPLRPLAPYLSVLGSVPGQKTVTSASGGGSTMDTIMGALTGTALLRSIMPTSGGAS